MGLTGHCHIYEAVVEEGLKMANIVWQRYALKNKNR
jgi:hypothetical protein